VVSTVASDYDHDDEAAVIVVAISLKLNLNPSCYLDYYSSNYNSYYYD